MTKGGDLQIEGRLTEEAIASSRILVWRPSWGRSAIFEEENSGTVVEEAIATDEAYPRGLTGGRRCCPSALVATGCPDLAPSGQNYSSFR